MPQRPRLFQVLRRVGLFFVVLILSLQSLSLTQVSYADDCDNPNPGAIDTCLAQVQKTLDAINSANQTNKQTLSGLEGQLSDIKNRIAGLNTALVRKQSDIEKTEKDLETQRTLLDRAAASLYVKLRSSAPFDLLLTADKFSQALQELTLRQIQTKSDRDLIASISGKLDKLKKDKSSLQTQTAQLASLQKQVDDQATFYKGEIAKADTYAAALSSKIQSLLSAKAGGLPTSVGDVPPADDPAARPDYNPGFSPAYAAFSFGAPHRTGMSQYGAYGRAKAGQSAESILSAYFPGAQLVKGYSVPGTINVDGYGAIAFEDNYIKGIGEVPNSWGDNGGMEALKAQAVVSRSYALAATGGGSGSICPTEACQVYLGHNKGGNWDSAAGATKSWVLVKDGSPLKTFYASTAGGYTLSQWGLSGIKDFDGSWPGDAYEGVKYGQSPWFYKGWYRTRSGFSCGRAHPWLNSEEFADIVNAAIIYKNNKGAINNLAQLDASSCWNQSIPDTWSRDQVRSEAAKYGGPVSSISSISTSHSDEGVTTNVSISTDKGTISVSGADFKTVFNTRAPSAIFLQSSLFNIEKK